MGASTSLSERASELEQSREESLAHSFTPDRRIAIILALDVVAGPVDHTIGSPVSIDQPPPQQQAAGGQAPPPQHQPQQHQPLQQQQYQPIKQQPYQPPPQAQQQQQYQPQQQQQQQFYQQQPPQHHNQQQGKYMAGGPAGAASSGAAGQQIYPIKSLNPYQTRWTIKARVSVKSDMRQWTNAKGTGKVCGMLLLLLLLLLLLGRGSYLFVRDNSHVRRFCTQLFHVDLVDAQGGEIRATMFNDSADQFFEIFEPNKVYLISKGTLKFKNKRFNPTPHEYELTLDQGSIVEEALDDRTIPHTNFQFCAISSIADCQADQTVDVIGVVTEVGNVAEIHTKAGKDLIKRTLTVADDAHGGAAIDLTLWGGMAEGFDGTVGTILAVKSARVSDYNGKGLSALNSSVIEKNPDRPEAYRLRAWFDGCNGAPSVVSLSQGQYRAGGGDGTGGPGGAGRGDATTKTLGQIRDEFLGHAKTDYANVKATVALIKHDTDPWYPSCPNMVNDRPCQKKVVAGATGEWHCDKCNIILPKPSLR